MRKRRYDEAKADQRMWEEERPMESRKIYGSMKVKATEKFVVNDAACFRDLTLCRPSF